MSNIILALDIDDCIFPSNQTHFGRTDDSLILLEVNLKRIVLMLDKYKMKVFITSSWYQILRLEDKELLFAKEVLDNKEYYREEYQAFLLLKKYLEPYIIGLSSGNRNRDIEKLLKEDFKVIAFDDSDLSDIKHKNYLYVFVHGYVGNAITWIVRSWIEKKEF